MGFNKNIIIVGKNSYIGSYFSEYAFSIGYEVISISSRDCNFLREDEVRQIFRSLNNTKNYTLVFLATINRWMENSFDSFNKNLQIINNLIAGCQLANIQSIIYFSSVDVYGNKPALPITEETQINPDSWYGLAKYACEWVLLSSGQVQCPVTVLRIPGIYGNAQNDRSVVGKMVSSLKNNKKVVIKGMGQNQRDYLYINDLCLLLQSLIPLKYQGILNVATGHSIPINEIVRLAGKLLNIEFEMIYEPAEPARDFDLMFDISLISSLVPNFRFSDLEEGIQSYL
ncbi:NAD-dependent epimerase/dehydratase family protein [Microcoleus sp. B7-D4]|uniref:NAD-dependent epimerase/dehydratase family protein n=1 Tax=Microcoleus sp. B7-D4 TaxID=2818696 RepID=UPI002FCF18A3